MPEDNQEPPKAEEPEQQAYAGEDISGGELDVPKDVPQEQISSPSMAAGRIEKAPKQVIIKRLVFLLLAIIVIAAAAVAAWKLIPTKTSSKKPAANNQNQAAPQGQADPVNLALGNTALSETYKSDFLRLEFKYPQNWKVTEQDNAIIVKSPSFDLADLEGSQVPTYFKVYIRQGAAAADGKYLGSGYAVAPSGKIAYAAPAAGQRKSTFLTDFGLDKSDNFAYFIVEGNFNLDTGDTLGPKFASEAEAFLIAGGFSTDEQKSGLETRVLPMDSYKNLAYQTGVEIVKSLQLK